MSYQSTFPSAKEARAGARDNLAIHAEIRFIEQKIYQAIDQGLYEVEINTSPMTTDVRYFGAWFSSVANRTLGEQLTMVRQNFVDLGYQMTPLKTSETTFKWRILW